VTSSGGEVRRYVHLRTALGRLQAAGVIVLRPPGRCRRAHDARHAAGDGAGGECSRCRDERLDDLVTLPVTARHFRMPIIRSNCVR
jgi:hypothetical protein